MPHPTSRSAAVALTSAALLGLSTLALPGAAGADEVECDPTDLTYAVTGGTIEWGFKQSFRSYFQNGAAGEWTFIDGADFTGEETGPDGRFVWPIAGGAVDATDTATAAATGGVHLVGHGGALDTTLSNPSLEIDGTEGVLKIDYDGFEQDQTGGTSVPVSGTQVVAATFDLGEPAAFDTAGRVTVSSPTSVIGEEFVPAFGSYPAGTELDPVTANLDITATCDGGPGGDDDNDDDQGTVPSGPLGSLSSLFGSLGG